MIVHPEPLGESRAACAEADTLDRIKAVAERMRAELAAAPEQTRQVCRGVYRGHLARVSGRAA